MLQWCNPWCTGRWDNPRHMPELSATCGATKYITVATLTFSAHQNDPQRQHREVRAVVTHGSHPDMVKPSALLAWCNDTVQVRAQSPAEHSGHLGSQPVTVGVRAHYLRAVRGKHVVTNLVLPKQCPNG